MGHLAHRGLTMCLPATYWKLIKKGLLFLQQSFGSNVITFSAPDEIRTHIDGTGNHNSIR